MTSHDTNTVPGVDRTGSERILGAIPPTRWFHVLATVVGIALIAWLSVERYRGPEMTSTDSVSRLNGRHVQQILEHLVGDGIPHPAGSEQNAVVRQRIISYVETLGYEVEVQDTEHFPWNESKNPPIALHNLMFRLPGTAPPDLNAPLVLAAHHDSARNAPGAADDGVGVAVILEIAQRMKSLPTPYNDVIFLITDGEEMGLLGAQRWVEQHPWAKSARWAINLEARGTCGASLMFETSTPNGWLAELLSQHLLRPNANSLSYEIYQRLPNDTDFTIFRRAGMAGFNFAFIGDVRNYHTPGDNWKNVSQGSIQHHADNAWQLAKACSDFHWPTDQQNRLLASPRPGQAVYFDVFGWRVIRWPAAWNWWLWGLTLVGYAFWVYSDQSSASSAGRRLFRFAAIGFFSCLGVVISAAIVWGMLWLFQRSERLQVAWPDAGGWVLVSSFLAATLGWLFWVRPLRRWTLDRTSMVALLSPWFALGALLCWQVPGGSFLVIAPLWSGLICLFIATWFFRSAALWTVSWILVCGFFWLPLEPMFYDALGLAIPLTVGIRLAFLTSCMSPLALLLSGSSWLGTTIFLGLSWLLVTIVVFQ